MKVASEEHQGAGSGGTSRRSLAVVVVMRLSCASMTSGVRDVDHGWIKSSRRGVSFSSSRQLPLMCLYQNLSSSTIGEEL